ncbi:hypothetical protein LOAG_02674 [Loa loa]|nr:hypothetical protein LOAG_02674 [Loa loa]EFO25812.1 hypothetical protein LOAG_02674 [Loa loa]
MNAEVDGIIEIDRNLQIATTATTSDVTQLELELQKAPAIEDVIQENKLVAMDAIEETEMIYNSDLRYASNQIVSTDKLVDVISMEATHENLVATKAEQRNTTANYQTVVREASVNKTVKEKDVAAIQMILQATQAESIDNFNFFDHQEELSGIEVILSIPEFEVTARNFVFSEENHEQLLHKLEERMEHIAIIEIPNVETTTGSAVEYNKEVTSLSGLFERITAQESAEQCTKIITDQVGLQIKVDIRYASSENITQDIVLHNQMEQWTDTTIIPEVITIQEYMDLQPTAESFIVQQSVLERIRDNSLEISTSIRSSRTKKAYARYPETGHEEEALVTGWSKVLRKATTEKMIPTGQAQTEKLSTVATIEENVEFSRIIEKMEPFDSIELNYCLQEIANDEKQLMVASETGEHSLLKESSKEVCNSVIPDLEIIQTQAHLIEYGAAQIALAGSFARLEHQEMVENVEIQIAASMKLQSYFDMHCAASESVSLQIQLERNCNNKLDESIVSIVQKPIVKFTMNLKEICEEVNNLVGIFETPVEHVSNVEHVFPDEICKAASLCIYEFGNECQQYMMHWDMIQNALSAEVYVAVADVSDIACTIDAVKQEDVQVIEQIKHPESLGFTDKTISLKIHASETGDWKIVEGNAEAIFQRFDEQIARQAINISIGYSEKQTGTFQEYGSALTETIIHFARILRTKVENYEVRILNSISRHWKECLNLEASKECIENLEKSLVKVESIEMINRIRHEVNHETVAVNLITSSEIDETYVSTFDKQSQCQSSNIIINDHNQESIISEQYVAQNEIAKLLDTTWSVIVNDFDTAINISESNRAQITLNTAASKEVQLESKNTLCMQTSDENASARFPTITAISGGERQFKIESKINESVLIRQQEELFAESVQKAIIRAENLAESIAETSEVHSDAGIMLMRRSATRTTGAASHVIGIALTLSQQLKTQYAQEISKEASVEFSIPASNLEIEDNIRQCVVNRDTVSLKTEYARARALQETVELTKSRKILAETESILKGAHMDVVHEKLKEADSEGFEILSQWTTVDRDLEAEVRLQHKHNIVSKFSTIATIEEEISIDEKWIATECNLETCAIRRIIAIENCQRSFQIEFDELRIRLENYEKEGNYQIIWCDKNYDILHVSMRESIVEKLNAMINLHRVSNVLPKQTTNEYIWNDKQLIVALPLYVKCDDIMTDYTTIDICIEQKVPREYLETVKISANWMEMEIFECEQAGDEKFRMIVELEGKRLAPFGVEMIWPEARKDGGIIVNMEEYLIDEMTIYAQIESKQVTFAESNTTISISQEYEPQMLITNTTKEEIIDGYDEFSIVSEDKAITYVIITGNKGECLSIWLQESKQNFITIGFQYSEEDQTYELEGYFVEKRFGGNYQLVTKAPQIEDRITSMEMLRQIENEAIDEVLKENVKKFAMMEVLAPISKVTFVNINLEKTPQMQFASMQQHCARKAESIRSYFPEIVEIMHTVYAEFKKKETSWKFLVNWKVSNYGGHLTLNTESAEETILDRQIDYHKNEAFENTIKILKQVITITVPVLSVQQIITVMEEISMDFVKPSLMDHTHLLLKQANRGINIEVKLNETTDITESSYLQFAKEVESIGLEKMIKEARFGGKLNLTTNASEEYELNVTRELTSDTIRIAHCNQLRVDKNYNRDAYCKVIAAKSESVDMHINLQNPESTDDAKWTVRQKLQLRDILTIHESEAIMLTINLNYIKQRVKEFSEKTIELPRNAEPCILITSATTDVEKFIQWILEKRRDTILGSSTNILAKNIVKLLPFNTIQSKFIETTIYPNLERIAKMLEVCKTLIAPNRGYSMEWKLHEIREENEYSNYHFKQENLMEQIGKILPQACYGGHPILNASAMKECIIDVILRLESKLPTRAEIYFSTNISNKSIPVVFSAKSTVSVESNEVINLERKSEIKNVAIIRKIANIEMAQIVAMESSFETENIIINYDHKEEYAEIPMITYIALYGGHQKLQTLAASAIVADIYEEFMSKHVIIAEACLHQMIANVAIPCKLSMQSSKFEECNQEYHLQKKRISENDVALALRVANNALVKFSTTESTNEIETINTHWERNEMYGEARLCIDDKRFGGSLRLSTYFAQESSILFTADLTASRSNLERVIFTIPTVRYNMEKPILATSSSTEMYAEISCHLNRPSIGQQSMITIHIANQIEAIIIQLTESTIISETTNIQYQRANAVVDAFSEVFPEVRFGGSLILNTLATTEALIGIQSLHSPQGPKQLEVQMIFMQKNHANEVCRILATTEQIITASVQFQKPNDSFSTQITKCASHRGDNQCLKLTEPSEINQFNNFSWKNSTEINAGQVIILKEIRFGGHLKFTTGYASEKAVTITDTLKQTSAELVSTISRKIANQGESISIDCLASQENHLFINLELQSNKLSQLEISVNRKTANREVPQQLITNEFSELMQTTNVTLQKALDYKLEQIAWKAKNKGGIMELQCIDSRDYLESQLSLKQHIALMLIIDEIRFGEHSSMNMIATKETIFNFDVSFEKQDISSMQSYTFKAMNSTLPEILETTESMETGIEIEKVEVWKRVSEMHAECAMKLPRQCLPVSLQTDSAEETFIRHEAEMHVNVQRIDGAVEIAKSASIMEREALTCTESLDVTLRHKALDEEDEEKVEKRVSFAAEVTEKTMSMDMSVTVEQRQTPLIIKKPMKKEQHGRRPILRQNEAPNFIPVRRNSLLLAMELGDAHNIPHYKTLEDVIRGIKKAGLEYSNLIFGIDYTRSNKYQGERTFDGRNLHALCSDEMNPYQQVIEIVGKTLSSFDADGVIPTYGFGDEESSSYGIFNLIDRNDMNAECNGFEEVLRIYNEKTPSIQMSGPTNFVPLIEQAVSIVREKHSYHILVIVADGQVTNEKINQKAIAAASRYPLSIIMVGVGDGPWNMMTRFDETLPKRMFDNFHFVDFHKVMFNAPNQEASFALNALMEIPDQYKAIKELGLLKQSRRG